MVSGTYYSQVRTFKDSQPATSTAATSQAHHTITQNIMCVLPSPEKNELQITSSDEGVFSIITDHSLDGYEHLVVSSAEDSTDLSSDRAQYFPLAGREWAARL